MDVVEDDADEDADAWEAEDDPDDAVACEACVNNQGRTNAGVLAETAEVESATSDVRESDEDDAVVARAGVRRPPPVERP